jgi:hypothetical protein
MRLQVQYVFDFDVCYNVEWVTELLREHNTETINRETPKM